MYSVTICHYVHSKLDPCPAEVLPRRTGNCGLAVKLDCLAGAEDEEGNGHQTVQSSGTLMTCGGASTCFVHDWQNKSEVCLFSLFSLTCWYDRLYEMKEVSNHFYSSLPLTFSWFCVQPVSFFISRTVTGVHILIETIIRFKYKLHLKLRSNAWMFHVWFIWKKS